MIRKGRNKVSFFDNETRILEMISIYNIHSLLKLFTGDLKYIMALKPYQLHVKEYVL